MSPERRIHLSKSARPAYDALDAFADTVGALAADAGIDDRYPMPSRSDAADV